MFPKIALSLVVKLLVPSNRILVLLIQLCLLRQLSQKLLPVRARASFLRLFAPCLNDALQSLLGPTFGEHLANKLLRVPPGLPVCAP